jgi:predicted nucleic acid-binding protein
LASATAFAWRIEGRARVGYGKLPALDSLLAATALRHDLTLVDE